MTDSPLDEPLDKPLGSPLVKRSGADPEPGPAASPAPAARPAESAPRVETPETAETAVRASDADRDRIADILREALAEGRLDTEEHAERVDAVYRAKTRGELAPLVRDLPAGREQAGAAPADTAEYDPTAGDIGLPAYGDKDNVAAVFSEAKRKGRFRVPRKINAVAVFGGVEIDLTEAVFEHRFLHINATAVFGGIEIRVPENVTLRQKGAGVFGGFDVRTAESGDPHAPVVLVEGAAVFGGVEAKPKRGRRLRDLRDRFRKEL